MIRCRLKKPVDLCDHFLDMDLNWKPEFPHSKFSDRARKRRRIRGNNRFPKLRRYVLVFDAEKQQLLHCPDIESCEEIDEPKPLYAPTDPDAFNYAWVKMELTHATNPTAFDTQKGDGIVIGIYESVSAGGADYTDAELGGTGNQAADWAAIQGGTHSKFVLYTDGDGNPIDPYGSGHGDATSRQAISVMDNAVDYCGSCPNGKTMMALGGDISAIIQRLADLGVDVISVSYTNIWLYRVAIQYATAAGVLVVWSHGSNTHTELSTPLPFEAIAVGGFDTSDQSNRSYGIGLTVLGRGPLGSAESWAAPAVAGIIGLILAQNPTWNIFDAFAALVQTCLKTSEMGDEVWTRLTGWGIPDAKVALDITLASVKPLPPVDLDVSFDIGTGVTLAWTNLEISRFDHTLVRRKENSYPVDSSDGTLVYSGALETYTDTYPVVNFGDWYYSVWGVSSDALESELLEYAQDNVTSSFDAPAATPSYTTCSLTWDAVFSATDYTIEYGIGAYDQSETSIGPSTTLSSLEEGTTYLVRIVATTPSGDVTSTPTSFKSLRGSNITISDELRISITL